VLHVNEARDANDSKLMNMALSAFCIQLRNLLFNTKGVKVLELSNAAVELTLQNALCC
jgi:hypothetical protein